MKKIISYLFIAINIWACNRPGKIASIDKESDNIVIASDTIRPNPQTALLQDSIKSAKEGQHIPIASHTPSRAELVGFTKTLIGIPYKYGSTDPSKGFDCSGFITYVFNHFGWQVPRSSIDFTNYGKEVNRENAVEGDLILFTGTIDTIRIVGHMGIITENKDTLKFIHSTSGKANGVTISDLSTYYQKRFVKIIRVFADQ